MLSLSLFPAARRGLFLFILLVSQGARSAPVDARALLDKVDDLYRGSSSRGQMTMTVETEHWSRALTLEFWSKGKDQSLLRVLSPLKERGTSTLKSRNNIWNYLPKVRRVIKLSSSMMSASWMGSHFTNDDLIKESRFTEDYTFDIVPTTENDDSSLVAIACSPKPDAAVVWGRVVVFIHKNSFLPAKIDYYDEDKRLARIMTFSDVSSKSGRILPTTIAIAPQNKPGEKTVVTYDAIEFDVPLADSLFSIESLRHP